jgi:hypothetical protein
LRRLLEEMEERPTLAVESEQGAGTAYELISPQT